jgi:hypothetical protein
MNRIAKQLIKIVPFLSASILGVFLYFFALMNDENLKSLLINISAAFIGIPLIFLGYDVIKRQSQKKLTREIFDYAKVQIDKEIFALINQLMKYVYPYDRIDKTPIGINNFMNLSKRQIKDELSSNTYIIFQMAKQWEVEGKNIKELLKNSLILQNIDEDKLQILIRILKYISYFDSIDIIREYIVLIDEKYPNYQCVSGTQINPQNIQYSDRFLLMEVLDKEHGKVVDFGDFMKGDVTKLLMKCRIQNSSIESFSESIFQFMEEINSWIKENNSELLIDPRYIRFRYIEDEKKS